MGLRPVAISTSPSKKDLALRLGAEAFLDSSQEDIGKALTEMGGAKIIVVTAGDGNILPSFLQGLGIGGTLLLLSFPTPTILPLGKKFIYRLLDRLMLTKPFRTFHCQTCCDQRMACR